MNTRTTVEKTLKIYGDSAEDIYVRFMKDYVQRLEPDSRSAYTELFMQLALKPSQKVLEVGIGTGRNIHRYPENVSLVGVDLTPEMLDIANKRASELGKDVKLFAKDATNLPFDDESFDAVVSTYTLCVTEEPQKVLAEMIRVCKPGGRIGLYECKRANSNPSVLKDQQILADTIRLAGLYFEGQPAVVYDLLFDLDALIMNSGLKVIKKILMEHSCEECLGMYVLQK